MRTNFHDRVFGAAIWEQSVESWGVSIQLPLGFGGVVRICTVLYLALLGISSTYALSAQQLSHPEDLAGRWEAPDGQGGEIGMNILISTTVPISSTDLIGALQKLEDFEIGLYHRSGSDVIPLGFNFFATSANGGATWDGRHLRIDLRGKAELPEVHVDLTWNDATRVWTGTFERAAFQNQAITLKRPTGPQNNLFVGTWFERSGLMSNCLHIAQAEDGTFSGWGDDIQFPGRIRYANGLRPPERTMEHYGEIAKVNMTEPDRIEVELRAYTPTCCSHPFTAAISRDGNSLVGDWPAGPNQAQRPAKWTRVQGDSCIQAERDR